MEEDRSLVSMDELIVIKQLPVIEEQLRGIKEIIESKVAGVLALGCTESTVSAIRTLRADLTKDFKILEEKRKLVKAKILEPYEAFDAIYKECVTDVYAPADEELKKRIDEVDNAIKAEKRRKAEEYFNEYLTSKGIDFVTFADANIKVNKSSSDKSLQTQSKAFIDRINDDLQLIYTQEHSEEILVEYKRTLNASAAIMSVSERHKAIEAERERRAQAEAARTAREEAARKVDAAAAQPVLTPPTETAPVKHPKGKLLRAEFPFTAMIGHNRDDLVAVKKALMEAAEKHNVQLIKF